MQPKCTVHYANKKQEYTLQQNDQNLTNDFATNFSLYTLHILNILV
jgi:hypothetical protein